MLNRRKFIATAGVTALAPGAVIAQTQERRQSMRDILFSNAETMKPRFVPDLSGWNDRTVNAAWIGHATVLINFYGTTIITDPVFSERAGFNILGLATLGPKRLVAPALPFRKLPSIDLILLSHAHMDHLDLPSLEQFGRKIPVVMAKCTSDVIRSLKMSSVSELDWGERIEAAGISIEGIQANHFGWRFPWEPDRAQGMKSGRSFNGYLLSKNGSNILFAGDTAYHEHYRDLVTRNIPIDLAVMPIGAYDPWIRVHASPEQAVMMAADMKAKSILPIHWGTFILSEEPPGEPIRRLKNALHPGSPLLAIEEIGQMWKLPD